MKPALKICGLRNAENISRILDLQPNYIGFVFYNGSERNASGILDPEFCRELGNKVKKVGVFVDDDEDRIINYIALYNLDYVQLHGNESPEYCARIEKYAPVLKAFGVDESFDFKKTNPYEKCCQFFLFDTKTKKHGGSGQLFDHALLKKYQGTREFFISGGISEENIEALLKETLPRLHAIDVNSKIETTPGIKDLAKVEKLKNRLHENLYRH